ncbi:hypothetical protein DFH06DRAFT_1348532 [Mycena polygramma]|nr:hypothetical protein DFH06DRAFT_1348532 [Mycena polygramma]
MPPPSGSLAVGVMFSPKNIFDKINSAAKAVVNKLKAVGPRATTQATSTSLPQVPPAYEDLYRTYKDDVDPLPLYVRDADKDVKNYAESRDTFTGQLLVEHRTKFGACSAMAQNLHNAVIHLGHQNGCVTHWTCRNWKGAVRECAGTVNVYTAPTIHEPILGHTQPPLYLTTHPITQRPLTSGAFRASLCPAWADPSENRKARREKEVKALLDKIQPDMVTLGPELIGSLAPEPKLSTTTTFDGKPAVETPFARLPRLERLRVSGKADETEVVDPDDTAPDGRKFTKEEKERKKMRGKGQSLKRYLRKQRKNVIDPTAVAIRAKLEKQRAERQARAKEQHPSFFFAVRLEKTNTK